MKPFLPLFLLLIVCFTPSFTQVTNQQFTEKELLVADLFELAENQGQASNFVTKGTFLTINRNRLAQLMTARPLKFTIVLPQQNKQDVVLELEQHQILAEDFTVSTPDGQEQNNNYSALHYQGHIRGAETSLAAISIFEDMVMGMVVNKEDTYVLGHLNQDKFPAGEEYIFYRERDMLVDSGFICQTDELEQRQSSVQNTVEEQLAQTTAAKVVKIYVECDRDTYLAKGSSVPNVRMYITGLFNQVAALYAAESITVQLSEIFVWTAPDPYTNPYNALFTFGGRVKNNFKGNVAHLVETVTSGLSGIAWVDELCSPYSPSSNSGPYAYSRIQSSYKSYPTYSWTVQVFTHETGHVLGSPHTHACEWGPNNNMALDNCAPTEGLCQVVSPQIRNTIMSYCSPVDFSKGFGTQPANRIRNRIASASCLSNVVLPLDLLSFQGQTLEKGNKLEWITATERNTKWHVIERSADGGKLFSEIGRLPAAEFSTQKLRYEWVDKQPLSLGYYRLKTVDVDGSEQLSVIIRLERKAHVSTLEISSVFPNPAKDWLQVQFQSPQAQQINLTITDLLGKVVYQNRYAANVGANTLQVSLQELVEGVYIVELTDSAMQRQMRQIVHQH